MNESCKNGRKGHQGQSRLRARARPNEYAGSRLVAQASECQELH